MTGARHVSPALQRSVFSFVVAKGLGGLADLNKDGEILLDEFHDFVRYNVASWVEKTSDGEETQTPVLLGSEVKSATTAWPHILYTRSLPAAESLSVQEEIVKAQDKRKKKGFVQSAANFISTELSNSGLAPLFASLTRSAKSAAGAVAGGGSGESVEESAAEDESESREEQTQRELRLIQDVW